MRSASAESPTRGPGPVPVPSTNPTVVAMLNEPDKEEATSSDTAAGQRTNSSTGSDKPSSTFASPPMSPEKPNFASLRAAMLAPAPAATRTPPRPGAGLEDSFDEGSSFEGSDVFPLSPTTPTPASPAVPGLAAGWNKKPSAATGWNTKNKATEEVSPFSPGSEASPPPKAKLSIQTFSPAATKPGAQQNTVPDTPDSPWDVDSEDEEEEDKDQDEEDVKSEKSDSAPARKLAGAAKDSKEDDDTSSVDSEVKIKHTPPHSSSISKLVIPSAFGGASGAAKGPLSNPKAISGPSVASVAQYSGSGASTAGAGKSPAKAKLSGSLLSSGRSSGPSLGFK